MPLLHESRASLATLIRDRTVVAWILILGLALSLALTAAAAPLTSGNSGWTVLFDAWLLALATGLALRFVYAGKRELVALDREVDALADGPRDPGAGFRAIERLQRCMVQVDRAREQNVWFGLIASILLLGTLSAVPHVLLDLIGELAPPFGVWWVLAYVSPVIVVWVVLIILRWGMLGRMESLSDQLSVSWVPHSDEPIEQQEESTGSSPTKLGTEEQHLAGLTTGLPSMLGRLNSQLQVQEVSLLAVLGTFVALTVAVASVGAAAFHAAPMAGGWYYYLFVIEVAGLLPAVLLFERRWRAVRRATSHQAELAESATTTESTALALTISRVRLADTGFLVGRRTLEGGLAIAVYGAIWLTLCLVIIAPPAAFLSEALVGSEGDLLVWLPILLAGYLVAWFWWSFQLFLGENKVGVWTEGLSRIEREFWSRY